MKQQLTLFLASNIYSCYAIDFQSMETVGPWYSAKDYSIFQLVNTYMSTTGDWHFLDETIRDNKQQLTISKRLACTGKR
jgi:hypothetical protein